MADAESQVAPTPATDANDLDGFVVEGGSLSIAGRDFLQLPEGLADKFAAQTTSLDASYNMISTLNGLEGFSQLNTLILDNNELTDDAKFCAIPGLKTLSINNNHLRDLDTFLNQAVEFFPNLEFLSMLKNPACPHALVGGDPEEYKRFRMRVIFRLQSLKFLDSQPVLPAERTESARIGKFLKVVKPVTQAEPPAAPAAPPKGEKPVEYKPLPQEFAQLGDHSGTFGVSKYVYYGRHSEGNRFIRNNDL